MKKKLLFSYSKICTLALLGASALFLTSCAEDGYDDDERFVQDTWNTKMVTPDASTIKVTPNAVGDKQTIEWPLVKGAAGFELKLEDVTDADAPKVVYEGVVDGCMQLLEREEDTDYRLTLHALGNKEYGNTDADNSSTKEYTTKIKAVAEIPEGDLAAFFTDDFVYPEGSDKEEVCYDLIPGGNYTLSKPVTFGAHKILLRSTSKTTNVKLTLASDANFVVQDGFRMRGFDIDMTATTKALIVGDKNPTIGQTPKGGFYFVEKPVVMQRCNIEGVRGYLFFDNSVKYCFKDLVINNCKIHLTSSKDNGLNDFAIIQCKSGYVNDINLVKSTIWQTGETDAKYFIQYNNSGRSTNAGLTSNSITHTNCTFYHVANGGQWFNCNGFNGQKCSTYFITNNIFVDCSNQVARRILGSVKASSGRIGATLFNNNTYWRNEADVSTSESEYDNGYILKSDPAFADVANADFTPTGAEQVEKQTGDPRWFETEE